MKNQRRPLWYRVPTNLSQYDLTIDLGEIKHASIKMKQTGKVSKKVLRKWRKRDCTLSSHNFCSGSKKCRWIPELNPNRLNGSKFLWRCTKCQATVSWVWEYEISESLLSAYKEHTRENNADAPI